MSTFDEDLFLKGLEQRKATLGSEYVRKIWPLRMISRGHFRKR
jgi:hypothetical protein